MPHPRRHHPLQEEALEEEEEVRPLAQAARLVVGGASKRQVPAPPNFMPNHMANVKRLMEDLQDVEKQRSQRRGAKWVSASEEAREVAHRCGSDSWQSRLLSFLQCRPAQKVLTLLLVMDVCCVFGELFIDAEFPVCSLVLRDTTSCCSNDVLLHPMCAAQHSTAPSRLYRHSRTS